MLTLKKMFWKMKIGKILLFLGFFVLILGTILLYGTFETKIALAQTPQASINANPQSCIEPCSPSISWTSNSNNIVKLYKNGVFWSNQSPNDSATDWNLTTGSAPSTYTYTIRNVDNSWVETGNLANVTVTVNKFCTGKPNLTTCLNGTTPGKCYTYSNGDTLCITGGNCPPAQIGRPLGDQYCNFQTYDLCTGKCQRYGSPPIIGGRCYQIGPTYNNVCSGNSCIQQVPPVERGFHLGGSCTPGCTTNADCTTSNFNISMLPIMQTIYQGDAATYGVMVNSVGGFSGNVSLAISGCPSSANCSLPSTTFVPANSYSTLILAVTNTASSPPTSNIIKVTGTSGVLSGFDSSSLIISSVNSPSPDLTAANSSPNIAVVNVAQTFSSIIANQGMGSTGSSFSNFFQVATASGGGGSITNLTATPMSILAAGANNTATSPTYTFTSTGTYSVRACADKTSPTNTGVITESNENNNCGSWSNVTVTGGVVTPTNLTGSCPAPYTQANVSWTASGYNPYYVRMNPGANSYCWPLNSCSSGGITAQISTTNWSFPTTPGQHYTWWFTVKDPNTNAWKDYVGSTDLSCQAPPSATVSISANNTNLPNPNNGTNLSWSYSGATSCSITPPATIGGYPNGSGSLNTGSLTSTKIYTIACNPGPVTKHITVNVASPSFNLNVIKSGQGIITSSPSGIACGPTCANNYEANIWVTLTATPAVGRVFVGWSGACSGKGQCPIFINSSKTVYANFIVDPKYREF